MITGTANRSAIGTLVERTSRYVLLVHLQGRYTTQATCSGVAGALSPLPEGLRKSLTWGQGTEMAGHESITEQIALPVFFCDAAVPGSVPRTRTPMACCGTTSPRAPTSPDTAPPTCKPCRTSSTTGQGNARYGARPR